MNLHRVTFYDAAYHALAIRHRGTMIAADRTYVKKAARRSRHAVERLAPTGIRAVLTRERVDLDQ